MRFQRRFSDSNIRRIGLRADIAPDQRRAARLLIRGIEHPPLRGISSGKAGRKALHRSGLSRYGGG